MAITTTIQTLFEGPNTLVQQVNFAGDETVAEVDVVDISAITGPEKLGSGSYATTSRVALMEASWNINSLIEKAVLSWTDEGNDTVVVTMSGDSAISYRGVGGKTLALPGTVEVTDGDVEIAYTNSADDANGAGSIWLVWKKKHD